MARRTRFKGNPEEDLYVKALKHTYPLEEYSTSSKEVKQNTQETTKSAAPLIETLGEDTMSPQLN